MIKRAILDIDDTLAPYSKTYYSIIKTEYNIRIPPSDWRWDTIKKIIGYKTFFEISDRVIDIINNSPPFPEVVDFTHNLKQLGYDILILTHRKKSMYDSTLSWLKTYNIQFDELIVTDKPKIQFVDRTCEFIVDDAPHTLKDMKKTHLKLFARKMRYNKDIKGVIRVSNLNEIFLHL